MQLFSAFLFGVGFACLLILGLYFPHSNKWRNAIVDRLLDAGIDWDESDPTLAINTLFTPDALLELERKKTIKDFYLIPVAEGQRRWACRLCGVPYGDIDEKIKCFGSWPCCFCGQHTLRPEIEFTEKELALPCVCARCSDDPDSLIPIIK